MRGEHVELAGEKVHVQAIGIERYGDCLDLSCVAGHRELLSWGRVLAAFAKETARTRPPQGGEWQSGTDRCSRRDGAMRQRDGAGATAAEGRERAGARAGVTGGTPALRTSTCTCPFPSVAQRTPVPLPLPVPRARPFPPPSEPPRRPPASKV